MDPPGGLGEKMTTYGSIEIRDLVIFKCPQCGQIIHSLDYSPRVFIEEEQICEHCNTRVLTEKLLVDFLSRESWPDIAQIVTYFSSSGFHVKLNNNGLTEIDLSYLLDDKDILLEMYIRKYNEYIFIQSAKKTSNLAILPKKFLVYAKIPSAENNVEVPMQFTFQKSSSDQDISTQWYRVFFNYTSGAESSFLYHAQVLIEKYIKRYYDRKNIQIPYKFGKQLESLKKRWTSYESLITCISTFEQYSYLRNEYTHSEKEITSKLSMDKMFARTIQFCHILDADEAGLISI